MLNPFFIYQFLGVTKFKGKYGYETFKMEVL